MINDIWNFWPPPQKKKKKKKKKWKGFLHNHLKNLIPGHYNIVAQVSRFLYNEYSNWLMLFIQKPLYYIVSFTIDPTANTVFCRKRAILLKTAHVQN